MWNLLHIQCVKSNCLSSSDLFSISLQEVRRVFEQFGEVAAWEVVGWAKREITSLHPAGEVS